MRTLEYRPHNGAAMPERRASTHADGSDSDLDLPFDQYRIVSAAQPEPSVVASSIDCFRSGHLVGCIRFYHEDGGCPQAGPDAGSSLVVWLPENCLPHIIELLHHESRLRLSTLRAAALECRSQPDGAALFGTLETIGRERFGKS